MIKKLVEKSLFSVLSTNLGKKALHRLRLSFISFPNYFNYYTLSNLYIKFIVKSILANPALANYKNKIWPYWINRQFNNIPDVYNTQNIPLMFTNESHRNWILLSAPNSDAKIIVDQAGLISPIIQSWSLDIWIKDEQQTISPANCANVWQKLDKDCPLVQTKFYPTDLDITSNVFFEEDTKKQGMLFNQIIIKNLAQKRKSFSFYFAIRPYNYEKIAPIGEISYLTSNAFIVDNQLALILDEKPDNIISIDFKEGDVSEHINEWEMLLKTKCPDSFASAIAEYKISLDSQEEKQLTCKINATNNDKLLKYFQKTFTLNQQKILKNQIEEIKEIKYEKAKKLLNIKWKIRNEDLLSISLPEKNRNRLFANSLLHIQNIIGKQKIDSTSFSFATLDHNESFAIILALNRIGAHALALQAINFFAKKIKWELINPVIKINEFNKLGQIIILIYDYYLLYRQKDILEKNYFLINLIVNYIKKALIKKNKQPDLIGILRKSCSEDRQKKDYYISDNYWALAALRAAYKIAVILKKHKHKEMIENLEKKLQYALSKLIASISNQRQKPLFLIVTPDDPISYNIINSLVSVYPLNLFKPLDEIINCSINILENTYQQHGALMNKPATSFITYDNCQLAQIYLMRQENEKAYQAINWLEKQASKLGTWPEKLKLANEKYYQGNGHCLRTNAEYLNLIRNTLAFEEGDTLHLSPLIDKDWLNMSGEKIVVKNLITFFGKINYSLEISKKRIVLELNNKYSRQPKQVKVSMPETIKRIFCLNQERPINDTTVVIPNMAKRVEFELQRN
jgi:hypothetical protein